MIIQSGIREVVYLSDKYSMTNSCVASRRMLGMAGVTLRRHVPEKKCITIQFPEVEEQGK